MPPSLNLSLRPRIATGVRAEAIRSMDACVLNLRSILCIKSHTVCEGGSSLYWLGDSIIELTFTDRCTPYTCLSCL